MSWRRRDHTSLIEDKVGGHVLIPMLNERFLGVLSTKENVNLQTLGFEQCRCSRCQGIINPIDIAGERLGNCIYVQKRQCTYDIEDIIRQ